MSAVPSCNIADALHAAALRNPEKPAVVEAIRDTPRYRSWSFAELDDHAARYAAGLRRVGIGRGTRTVLMVPPGLEFFALVFALYRVGATLVLIDPGIDKKQLRQCLGEVAAEAFVGVPLAHVARIVFRDALATVQIKVTVGRRWFWGGHRLQDLLDPVPLAIEPTAPDDVAAVLFTSGSTGVPKGALYTHAIFSAQVRMLQELYGFGDDEVDLSTFPLFALFLAALGVTSVIPDMDARHPALADPVKLRRAMTDHGCTTMFGSPALLDTFSTWAVAEGVRCTGLRRVLSAGAPVRHDILLRMRSLLDDGVQVFTPYGATEALPVANVGSDELLDDTHAITANGGGVNVGRPVAGMCVRIIAVSDDPIPTWSDDLLVPVGTIGEITVRGAVVTPSYLARDDQTALAKIDDAGRVVHRMGDVGSLDAQGRLFMCGRKSHRLVTALGTMFTVPVEMVFNSDPGVRRTALVGRGSRPHQTPVLLVERPPGATEPESELIARLLAMARERPLTEGISEVLVYPQPFPVDIRHNAKIHRESLTLWVNEREYRELLTHKE